MPEKPAARGTPRFQYPVEVEELRYTETVPGSRWEGTYLGIDFWIVKWLQKGKPIFGLNVKVSLKKTERSSAKTFDVALKNIESLIKLVAAAPEGEPPLSFEELRAIRALRKEMPANWDIAVVLKRGIVAQQEVGYDVDFSELLSRKLEAGRLALKPYMTTRQCLPRWEEEQHRRRRKDLKTVTPFVRDFCDAFPGTVSDLRCEKIQAYLNDIVPKRKTSDGAYSYQSLSLRLKMIKSFLETCRRQNALPLLAPLPTDGVSVPVMLDAIKTDVEFYSLKEVRKTMDFLFRDTSKMTAARRGVAERKLHDLRFSFCMQFFGGVRPKTPGMMSKADLLVEGRFFRVQARAGKAKFYQSPRGPTLVEWLRPYDETENETRARFAAIQDGQSQDSGEAGPKFPIARYYDSPEAAKTAMWLLLKKQTGRTIHEAGRKTFATYLYAILKSMAAVARALGDTVQVTETHYVNKYDVSIDDALAYFALLPQYSNRQPPTAEEIRLVYGA